MNSGAYNYTKNTPLSPLEFDQPLLQEPLLSKAEQETAHGMLDGVSIAEVPPHDSNASRGYHPPVDLASHFSNTTSDSRTAAPLPLSRSASSISVALPSKNNFLNTVRSAVDLVRSGLKSTPARDPYLSEKKRAEQELTDQAVEAACFHLRAGDEERASTSIRAILKDVDRLTFTASDRPDDVNKEVEKVLALARKTIMTDAQAEARKTLNRDPAAQSNDHKALEILKKAIYQTTPFKDQILKLSPGDILKKAEDLLTEIRATL